MLYTEIKFLSFELPVIIQSISKARSLLTLTTVSDCISCIVFWWVRLQSDECVCLKFIVWLSGGAVGSSGNKWSGRVLVIWDMLSPYRSSHLHCQLSHLAASGILGLSEEQAFKELSNGSFWCASLILSYIQPSLCQTWKGRCHETLLIKTTGGRSF